MTSRAGEFDLIARHFAPLAGDGRVRALGLADDAALLVPRAGTELVLTADALVAGVHFLPDDPPDLVARKALRVNLSDLAAKGAAPLAYLLCLSLPTTIGEPWFAGFAAGLAEDQRAFGIALAGGDTTSTPGPATIAITAIGEVDSGTMLRRSGARPGDDIWVSGTIGDAALGLRVLRGEAGKGLSPAQRDTLADRYRLPRPRVALGRALSGSGVSAMDVSDGLVQDLGHVARLAGCGAEIDEAAVPLSQAAAAMIAADSALFDVAVSGGDDYELLLAAPPAQGSRIAAAAAAAGTDLRRVGRLVAGEGVSLRTEDGRSRRLARGGWTHF
jgi:thiamine-monophosphate kinase